MFVFDCVFFLSTLWCFLSWLADYRIYLHIYLHVFFLNSMYNTMMYTFDMKILIHAIHGFGHRPPRGMWSQIWFTKAKGAPLRHINIQKLLIIYIVNGVHFIHLFPEVIPANSSSDYFLKKLAQGPTQTSQRNMLQLRSALSTRMQRVGHLAEATRMSYHGQWYTTHAHRSGLLVCGKYGGQGFRWWHMWFFREVWWILLVYRDWILSKIFSPKSLDLTVRFCEIRNGTVVTFRKWHLVCSKEYMMKLLDDYSYERHQMLYAIKVLLGMKHLHIVSDFHNIAPVEVWHIGTKMVIQDIINFMMLRVDMMHLGRETLPIFVPEIRKSLGDAAGGCWYVMERSGS